MKLRIFQYLFIFAALIILYLAVSSSRKLDSREKQIQVMESSLAELRDSLQGARLEVLDMQYFSLENNDDAMVYYEHLEIEDTSRYISDKLLETNEQKGDNPLVPYQGMEGDFKINKIKILNHRWIIADFSDGKFWGELLIEYELNDDLGINFTLLGHLLYTRSQ